LPTDIWLEQCLFDTALTLVILLIIFLSQQNVFLPIVFRPKEVELIFK